MLTQSKVKEIQQLPSKEAANLLMENLPIESPDYSEAFQLIQNRSWKKLEQIKLANFYLQKMPFATPKPYEVLISIMDLVIFMTIIKEKWPTNIDSQELILYHLNTILKQKIKSPQEKNVVDEFLLLYQNK